MGRKIIDYNGVVQGVSSTYPYGQIKNNPNGTTIDVTSNGDIQQFFQRAAALSGVVLNDDEDNFDNGWQYVDGVAGGINSYCVRLVRAMIGAAYDPTKWYVLTGTATSATQGWLFFNNNIYHVGTYSGPICGGGTVLVGSILPSTSNTWYKEVNLTCAVAGSGAFNYTDLVRVWGVNELQAQIAMGAWQNPTVTGSGWAAGISVQPRFRKDGMGRVYMQGIYRTTAATPAIDIFTLPVGYRPSAETLFPVIGYNGSVFIAGQYLRILTSGEVQLLTAASVTGSGWYFDTGSIIFLTT